MGQTQSSSYHPSAVGSHNFHSHLSAPQEDVRRQDAAQRSDVPRSFAIPSRLSQQPHLQQPSTYQPLIPRELRQSGAGPIRHRPTPPEYATQESPYESQGRSWGSTLSAEDDWTSSQQKRRSVHRISATPRDPPLLEESESVRDHESEVGKAEPSEPVESDHGHPPQALSPSLALALKAGLGSGSLRRTPDGLVMQSDADTSGEEVGLGIGKVSYQDTALRDTMAVTSPHDDADASADKGRAHLLSFWERRSSSDAAATPIPVPDKPPADRVQQLGEDTPRGPDGAWQSQWDDLRQHSSSNTLDPSLDGDRDADAQPPSRFSMSSSEMYVQEPALSDSERGLFGPSRSRFSYTATESSGSNSGGKRESGRFSPDSSASQPARISLDRQRRLAGGQSSSLEPPRTHLGPHHPIREQSQSSMYSAAAPSSDFDPAMTSADYDMVPASSPNLQGGASAMDASSTTLMPAAVDTPRPIFPCSDETHVRDPPQASQDSNPTSGPGRRPRAFSLMNMLRGRSRRASDATGAEPVAANVTASNSTLKISGTFRTPSSATSMPSATSPSSSTPGMSTLRNLPVSETGGGLDVAARSKAASRPTSVYSASTLRSRKSSNISLRTKSLQQAQAKRRVQSSAAVPWWKQSSLKRKGSAGASDGAAGKSLRYTAKKQTVEKAKAEDEHWEDMDEEVAEASSPKLSIKQSKQGGSSWLWSRRPDNSKMPTMASARLQSSPMGAQPDKEALTNPQSSHAVEPGPGKNATAASPLLDVPVVEISRDPSLTGFPNPTANSSASSFTSLALPKAPAPVPPLRRPRRPSHRRIVNTDSTSLAVDESSGRLRYDGPASPNPSEAMSTDGLTETSVADTHGGTRNGVSTPGTSVVDVLSHTTSAGPVAPDSRDVASDSQTLYIVGPGGFAPATSPTSANFSGAGVPDSITSRMSSDTGTKEILLSDRESDTDKEKQYPPSLLPGSKSAQQAPPMIIEDEQHPEVHILAPGARFQTRQAVLAGLPATFPGTRREALHMSPPGDTARTQPTDVDLSADSAVRKHARGGTDNTSFQSFSDSAADAYRVPSGSLSRAGPFGPRREGSGAAESFVTAHSNDVSEGQGRPSATSPQHSPVIGTSEPGRTGTSRPLPQIPEPRALQRGSTASAQTGPPLSPSAGFTESQGGLASRQSWSSSDGPWSAEIVSRSQFLAPVRGLAVAQHASLGRASGGRALPTIPGANEAVSGPQPTDQRSSSVEMLTDLPAKPLTRQPSASSSSSGLAPFADTGVQASLAALRALESPGTDARTFWARQRMFGERDTSTALSVPTTSHMFAAPGFDDATDVASGLSRQRRRMDPYSTARSIRSSDGVSSSGSRRSRRERNVTDSLRVARKGRHHVWDQTSMADVSSASLAETSGGASDSDAAMEHFAKKLYARRQRAATSSFAPKQMSTPVIVDAPFRQRARTATLGRSGWDSTPPPQSNLLPYVTPPRSNMQRGLPTIPRVEVTPSVAEGTFPPAASLDNSSSTNWDDVIVPAVRKRLEREAVMKSSAPSEQATMESATVVSSSGPALARQKQEAAASTRSPSSHIPFPSDDTAGVGSYLDVDPYTLPKADRELYRRMLERQLIELDRADRSTNEGFVEDSMQRVRKSRTARGSGASGKTRERSNTHQSSRLGEPTATSAPSKKDSASWHQDPHRRDRTSGSDAHHTINSRKASTTSRSRGKSRRPSKQGYTGDDILAWKVGLDLSSGPMPSPPPLDAAEPV